MNALIVSFNFNPGHFSHLVANYRLFQDAGFNSYLYVNKSFNSMDEENEFDKINKPTELRKLAEIDVAVFWFPSLRNIFEIIRLRLLFKSKIIYVYHEPFDSILNYYKSGFGALRIIKIILINFVNLLIIFLSHGVVLPSSAAFRMYEKKYYLLNNKYSLIPLLFSDESDILLERYPKKYVSYIGTVAADHAFDRFVDFVDLAIKNDWHNSLNFLIATRSIIPHKERKILEPYLQSGRLVIVEGSSMSNKEINEYYKNSLVVWNAYNRSMQSGVLPKAYMFGASVIVQLNNANEFVENHVTGVLIDRNDNALAVKSAIDEIFYNKAFFFENCRRMFLSTFYYKTNAAKFLSLLN